MAAKTSRDIKRERTFNGGLSRNSSRGKSAYFNIGFYMMKQFDEEILKKKGDKNHIYLR